MSVVSFGFQGVMLIFALLSLFIAMSVRECHYGDFFLFKTNPTCPLMLQLPPLILR